MSDSSEPKDNIQEAIRTEMERRIAEIRPQLESRWSEALGWAMEQLAAPLELDEGVIRAARTGAGSEEELARLSEGILVLGETEDQVALLNQLVDTAAGFSGRTALFVVRHERAVGWMAAGFGTGDASLDIRQVTLPLDGPSPLALAVSRKEVVQEEGSGEARLIWEALEAGGSEGFVALPLLAGDRVVAVLFSDAGDSPDSPPLQAGALRILVQFSQAHLNSLRQRGRAVSRGPASAIERRSSQAWEAPKGEGAIAIGGMSGTPEVADSILAPSVEVSPAPAGSEDAHEEARRFARLLVSEILLYNEARVEEGRKNSDLSERLKEDLERSEQMYRQRAAAEVVEEMDYFQEEVVRTLANGDRSLLGTG
jgi:hypothetical protein